MQRYYTATVTLSITATSHAAATQTIEEAIRLYNDEQVKSKPNGGRGYAKVEEVNKLKEDK